MRYRTTVTNSGSTSYYDYVWDSDKLVSIVYTSGNTSQTAKYLYGSSDEVIGMVITDSNNSISTCYYLRNAQGDITGIVNSSGKKIISYTYDVFGNCTETYHSTTATENTTYFQVNALNPFGYRGYCYDDDMGLYYLQSRYYDPQICRFINADSSEYLGATGTVLSCNLFAYCENDPVNMVDPKGNLAITTAIKTALGVAMGAAAYLIQWFAEKYILKENSKFNWGSLFLSIATSVIDSWISLKKVKNIASFAVTFISTILGTINSNYTIYEVLIISLVVSLVSTLISTKITKGSASLGNIARYNKQVSAAWKKAITKDNFKILRTVLHNYFKKMNSTFAKYISSSTLSALFDTAYKTIYAKIKKKGALV